MASVLGGREAGQGLEVRGHRRLTPGVVIGGRGQQLEAGHSHPGPSNLSHEGGHVGEHGADSEGFQRVLALLEDVPRKVETVLYYPLALSPLHLVLNIQDATELSHETEQGSENVLTDDVLDCFSTLGGQGEQTAQGCADKHRVRLQQEGGDHLNELPFHDLGPGILLSAEVANAVTGARFVLGINLTFFIRHNSVDNLLTTNLTGAEL